mmetsp:Transcript_139254/g.361980  ORF Transcript_139254/g.361980 Transcript_139254/m.361980 type:complete len:934 (+) Transcript_139254:104-2905(+)
MSLSKGRHRLVQQWALTAEVLLVLVLASLASGAPNTPRNRAWPADLEFEAPEDFSAKREEVCARSGARAEEESVLVEEAVLQGSDFKAVGFSDAPGGKDQALDRLLGPRRDAGLVPAELAAVGRRCVALAIDGSQPEVADSSCTEQWNEYASGLLWPYLTPMIIAGTCIALHFVCCFVACCRCCRRCRCCKERGEPHYATRPKVLAVLSVWIVIGVGMVGIGTTVHAMAFTIHESLNWHLCTVFQVAEEAIWGTSRMRFMGMNRAYTSLSEVAVALDVDGAVAKTVRSTIEETAEFAMQQEKLRIRVEHFTNVLQRSGPDFRAFEHRCVFCGLAAGDPEHPVAGFPEEGLLPAFAQEMNESSSQAMVRIRGYMQDIFTDDGLEDLAGRVKRAIGAVEILDNSLQASLIQTYAKRLPTMDTLESIRIAVFVLMGILAYTGTGIGTGAFFITKIRARTYPDLYPSGKPHCCSWCCSFFLTSLTLTITGILLLTAVFAGEGCLFLRQELLTHEGIQRYSDLLGLLPVQGGWTAPSAAMRQASADMAVDLARTCFAANGTGDMVGTMGLSDSFAFQPGLSEDFYTLDDLVAFPPTGKLSVELLETLRETAESFGGTFVLDPLPLTTSNLADGTTPGDTAVENGTLGVLELNPNVQDLLLGSSISPDNTIGPENTFLQGLNSYAALIAGPGKYTFLHGTAGGGFVITPDSPGPSELATLPPTVQHAILYGRSKEHLLASTDALRCDRLTDDGQLEEHRCGVAAFREYVLEEVALIEEQANIASTAALGVQELFLNELRTEMLAVLRRIRDLRMMTGCRFLWARIETLDNALCEDLAPMAATTCVNLMTLAGCAACAVFVQYKVWRHLKDNKVVGQEMERFERRHSLFTARVREMEETKARAEAERRAYQQKMEDGFIIDETTDQGGLNDELDPLENHD